MNFHKILIKIAYWMVAISIVVLIAITFFGQRIIKQASEEAVDKDSAVEETTNINMSGMTIIIDKDKGVKKTDAAKDPADNTTDSSTTTE